MKTISSLNKLARTLLTLLTLLPGSMVSASPQSTCVLPTPQQQAGFNPPITETVVPNPPVSYGHVTLANVPPGYSVTNGGYIGWCMNPVQGLTPGTIYYPTLYDTYDLAGLASIGLPTAGNVWNKINYIINHKPVGANASTIQAAIWRFINFSQPDEDALVAGTYGYGFPAADLPTINAIQADANLNGASFFPGPGQVTAVYLDLPIPPQTIVRQPFIIEVQCLPVPWPCTGQIGDFVWYDGKMNGVDCNGVQDPAELTGGGIPNVAVGLYDSAGTTLVASTATDSTGHYVFRNLCHDTYIVRIDASTLPAGYLPVTPFVGNDSAMDSNGAANGGGAFATLATDSSVDNTIDFGFCTPCTGKIGDFVWYDGNTANCNGIQNVGDPGLPNIRVYLRNQANSIIATQFTDSTGHYQFTGLCAGTYSVQIDTTTLPAGYSPSPANRGNGSNDGRSSPYLIQLATDSSENFNADFGYCSPCSGRIGDFVWQDLNGNGLQETGEPGIPNVGLVLKNSGGTILATTMTDFLGNYFFNGLCAGTYTVEIVAATLPPGLAPTLCTAGSDRAIDNNCSPATVFLPTDNSQDLTIDFGYFADCSTGVIGGIDLSGIANNFLFFFADGNVDANWQGATKGFVGNVLLDGIVAKERTSGGVPYAGTIYTNDTTLGAWQAIVSPNAGQASGNFGNTALVSNAKAKLLGAFAQIDALPVTPGFTNRSSTSLNGLNTQNGIAERIVINVTSGFQVSSKIYITGDATDTYVLRWDTDSSPANGYQGIVKFQSGGAIVPLGALKASNFIHVAGDINAAGGGGNPAAPYPQGPRYNSGTGGLINGGSNFSGGGFFTGYWLTTGDPANGTTQPLSNGIFVGGWYTLTTKFSMTSGTSGVYIAPNCPPTGTALAGCVYVDLNGSGRRDTGLATGGQWGIFVINGGVLSMNSSHITGSVALGPLSSGSTLQKTDISGTFNYDPSSTWDQTNLGKDFLITGGAVAQSLAQAQAEANTASTTFAAMTPTQIYGDVTGSLSINGNGGLNVIRMNSLNYNSKTLTLVGGANDSFIVNVAGGWILADSKIMLSGVTADHVVFNFATTGSAIDMYKATNVINGTFLAPYRSVIYHNPASFNGQIIAKNVTIHSDANLTSTPLTTSEPCLAGVTVQLSNSTTATQLTTISGYTFLNLGAGSYSIAATSLPPGYSFFKANPGSFGGTAATVAPAMMPAQNAILNIQIPSGGSAINYDFAVKRN